MLISYQNKTRNWCDLAMSRLNLTRQRLLKDRTRICGKILRWLVVWSERLIKLRNSWFSAKSILVERLK